ncbi:MAG: ComF family protein [Patescibacteria group bacterium]
MFLQNILKAVFPSSCLNCGKDTEDDAVCEKCVSAIKINNTLFCGKCRARLPVNRRNCHKNHPYILGAATNYDDVMKNIVHGLKFRRIRDAAKTLGRILASYTSSLEMPIQKFCLIPIPLSPRRLRERGFNQAELIAVELRKYLNLNMRTDVLERTRNTSPQSEIKNLAERKINVRDCFRVKDEDIVSGKSFILVDDITTSGATLEEAARALKNAGAKTIVALTAAKA